MQTKGFKELVGWQKSYQLALRIYKLCDEFPKHEVYGLGQQLRRSAVSVPSNIAEGYGRQHNKEYTQFLGVAYGSLCELETQCSLAVDLGYIRSDETVDGLLKEVGAMLYRMIKPIS